MHSETTVRSHFLVQNPFPINGPGIDDVPVFDSTCLWYKQLTNNIKGNGKRMLGFK